MLARVVLALAPCVLCLRVLALGVVLAVDGVAAARVAEPMLLLGCLLPDQVLADCGRVLRAIVVDLLGGVFDHTNNPTGHVDGTSPKSTIDRLYDFQRMVMVP